MSVNREYIELLDDVCSELGIDMHELETEELEVKVMERVRRLILTEDKLPRYRDTGEAFVPTVDPCFRWSPAGCHDSDPEWLPISNEWVHEDTDDGHFYRTKAAAEAARQKGGE